MRSGMIDVPGGRVWYEERGSAARTPLLLLHGGPGFTSRSFGPILGLADQRPVIIYDQLGAGRSERPDNSALWTLDRFVAELSAVREALGLAKLHILGHSWGTMLLAAYLATDPAGIGKIIFSGPCLDAVRWSRDQQEHIRRLPAEDREVLERREAGEEVSDAAWDRALQVFYRRHYCRLDPWPAVVTEDFAAANDDVYQTMWGPAEFRATGSLKGYDATAVLRRLSMPVLFLCGRFDEATPETTKSYANLVPDARMQVLESSSHLSYVEEPDCYQEAVTAFLDE